MANLAVIAKIIAVVSDKKNRKWVLPLLLTPTIISIVQLLAIPIILLSAIMLILNPSGDELQNDPYYQAINSIREERDIANDISVYLVKSVDLIYSGDVSQDTSYTMSFVEEHFVSSYEEEEEVLVAGTPDGEPQYVTKTRTVYYFISATEMLARVQDEPYNFSEADIKAIQELFLEMEGGLGIPYEGKYPMPMDGYISSGYGNRTDPISGKYDLHPAVDIVPPVHRAPVKAIADGEVYDVVTDAVYGNNVTMKHNDGTKDFYTFSAHLSRVDVTVGQQVNQGQVIGTEGGDQKLDPNPGRTTGHHLHFEIWEKPDRSGSVNPAKYLHERYHRKACYSAGIRQL